MKYAVIEVSGRQFWVEIGKYYDFNRISSDLGKQITINRILLLHNGKKVILGQPYLQSTNITTKILNHFLDNKKCVYKMQPKKKTRKKQGHRQQLTRVFIENINMTKL